MRKPYTRWQRLLGFGLSLAVILLLAACGAAKTAKTNAAAKPAATVSPEKKPSGDGEERGLIEAPADEAIGGFYGSHDLDGGFDFHYASGDAPVAPGAPGVDGEGSDPGTLSTGTAEPDLGEAFVLTAAEWNDNENWPFFTNLVNAGTISFPSFGIDPRNRIVVTLTDAAGAPLGNEPVRLKDADGAELWTARTDKNGTAYLFFGADQTPDLVEAGGVSTPVNVQTPDGSGQGTTVTARAETLTVTGTASAAAPNELQVMFLVDTTGSMADDFKGCATFVSGLDVGYNRLKLKLVASYAQPSFKNKNPYAVYDEQGRDLQLNATANPSLLGFTAQLGYTVWQQGRVSVTPMVGFTASYLSWDINHIKYEKDARGFPRWPRRPSPLYFIASYLPLCDLWQAQ